MDDTYFIPKLSSACYALKELKPFSNTETFYLFITLILSLIHHTVLFSGTKLWRAMKHLKFRNENWEP